MKVLILAAGYATRLYPLTKDFPKPLLLINNRPIIDYIIDKLEALKDIDEIMVVTNSKFIAAFRQWKRRFECSKKISLIDDLTKTKEDRRGAIGDMHFAIKKKLIKDDLLVIGADNLFDESLDKFLAFARANKFSPTIGVFDAKDKKLARNYGVIKLNKKEQVIDFKEKPAYPDTTLVAMCLYYFPKRKLSLVDEYMIKRQGYNDAIGLYIDWLRQRESVYGFVFRGKWFDIGQHTSFEKAKQKF